MELIREFERRARDVLPTEVYEYYAGGAGDEHTLADNVEAWRRVWLRPRGLGRLDGLTCASTVLGDELGLPVVVAPMGLQGRLHPDGEAGAARAAVEAGAGFCLSTRSTDGPEAVAAAMPGPGAPLWFQLYVDRDRAVSEDLLRRVGALGFRRVVLTIDLVVVGRRERERRQARPFAQPGGWATALTWDALAWVRETSGLPVTVKGVLTAEDARLAAEHGAEAVIVSNHGGRQLDGAVPTAVALVEVAGELAGELPVLVDGGLRSGADVARALALGASGALVGRPFAWALAAGGAGGVRRLAEALEEDLRIALALLACSTPDELTGGHVRLRGW